jgi:hypothetical protein
MADSLRSDLRFAILPEWVLDAEISDRAVRLYAVLARHANAAGVAFPARATIARRLRCSTKSVDRALAELAAAGAVTVQPRFVEGRQTSSLYTLRAVEPGSVVRSPVSTRGDSPVPPGGVTAVPQNESQMNETTTAPAAPPRKADVLFEALASVGGHDLSRLTRAERGRINAAAKQLRELGATPDDVTAARKVWVSLYPSARCTVMALVNHWSELQRSSPARAAGPNGRSSCDVCATAWSVHTDELCALFSEAS